jgi:hypothetical protein
MWRNATQPVQEDIMRINIKKMATSAVATLAVALGASAMGAAPAQATDTSGDFHFTVVAKDFAKAKAAFSVENRTRLTVNGATQLTWWYPNHNITVSKKSLRKAPRITVKYTACSKQSQSIAKQAHRKSVVIAKVGSYICNTGRNGNIVGGFKWHVTKAPAVLKWNASLHLYQHVYNIVGGKLVKTCGNRMGGHVDVMYPSVVQVRYAQDVKEHGNVVARAAVGGEVTFNVTCPNGANFNTKVTTSANAQSYASVDFTSRTLASVISAHSVSLTNTLQANGEASATAAAETKIEVSGSCGTPNTPAPTATEIDTINDVLINNSRTVTVSGSVASGHTGTLTCHANSGGGSITAGKSQALGSGSFTKQVTYTAGSEVGTDSVTCNVLQDDGQSASVTSNTFQIKQPIADPA